MEIETLEQILDAVKDAQWRILGLSKSGNPLAHRLDGPVMRKLIKAQVALTKQLDEMK